MLMISDPFCATKYIPEKNAPEQKNDFNKSIDDNVRMSEKPIKALPKSIFRAYDIRGCYEKEIDESVAFEIGWRFASFVIEKKLDRGEMLVEPTIIVGRDGRTHSPVLKDAFVRGLMSCGANVVDLGIVPTPVVWYSQYDPCLEDDVDACVMITASHNPKEDNGFKMNVLNASLTQEEIHSLLDIEKRNTKSIAKNIPFDIRQNYIERILRDYEPESGRTIHVIFDPGHGAACRILKNLLPRLNIEYEVMNGTLDGTFPSHEPDPSVTYNIRALIERVKETRADFGVAFDGDADRISIVDDRGNHWNGDLLLLFFASSVIENEQKLSKKPPKIIGDVQSSLMLPGQIKEWGGEFVFSRVGHSFIKKKIKEIGAVLAGEMSGHFSFNDHYYGFDDGIYSAVRLIEMVKTMKEPLSTIYENNHTTCVSQLEKRPIEDELKFKFIESLKDRIKLEKQNEKLSFEDGVRIDYPDGWWLIRASNTQSMISARCEGINESAYNRIYHEMKSYLNM
jgi:phosphomannomutase